MTTATRIKELYGATSEAYAADPSQSDIYEFRYKVMDLDDLIASHDKNLQPNDQYPQELQPRLRDRAASKTQVENIARNLNARALLHDTGFIDTGPMIIGNDNVVESGNGRVLGLRLAANEYPQRYRLYKTMLANQSAQYGFKESEIEDMAQPVLVRERVTKVDRVKFARAANVGAVMGMSPYEQAINDSKKLKSEIISTLEVGEDQTIDQALRARVNDNIVKHFVSTVPENERATIADAKGQVNIQGMNRLKLAIFTKTYTGESGQRLARIFSESADPQIKSIENAMFQTLPEMAKAESLIDTGSREKDLSIAPDLAEVIDTYAGIKTSGITVKDYLSQQAMFEDRLNASQKVLLDHLDDVARKPKLMREFMRDTAQGIIDAPAKGQSSMMGFEPITKEGLIYGIINKQRTELGKQAITPAAGAAASKGLEKPDTGRIESTKSVAGEVGAGDKQDTGGSKEIKLAPSTSVQVGLAGLGKETAQVKMFGESNTAAGQGGKVDTLIDVEAIKAKEADKPLPGQIDFLTGKTVEGEEIPQGGQMVSRRPHKAEKAGSTPAPATTADKYKTDWKKWIERGYKGNAPHQPEGISGDLMLALRGEAKKEISGGMEVVHNRRSPQSRAMDEAQGNKITIGPLDRRAKGWMRDQGRADIRGIDTPNLRISRKTPRISGRTPRITPKMPKLR